MSTKGKSRAEQLAQDQRDLERVQKVLDAYRALPGEEANPPAHLDQAIMARLKNSSATNNTKSKPAPAWYKRPLTIAASLAGLGLGAVLLKANFHAEGPNIPLSEQSASTQEMPVAASPSAVAVAPATEQAQPSASAAAPSMPSEPALRADDARSDQAQLNIAQVDHARAERRELSRDLQKRTQPSSDAQQSAPILEDSASSQAIAPNAPVPAATTATTVDGVLADADLAANENATKSDQPVDQRTRQLSPAGPMQDKATASSEAKADSELTYQAMPANAEVVGESAQAQDQYAADPKPQVAAPPAARPTLTPAPVTPKDVIQAGTAPTPENRTESKQENKPEPLAQPARAQEQAPVLGSTGAEGGSSADATAAAGQAPPAAVALEITAIQTLLKNRAESQAIERLSALLKAHPNLQLPPDLVALKQRAKIK